jgi:hypothetical protein
VFKVQWRRDILLDESHKLNPRPLDEGPRPKSGKSRLNLNSTVSEGKSTVLKKKNPKKESS